LIVLGIDLGTSALKAVLVDSNQVVLAQSAVPLRTANPRPGWSEQRPDDWWSALLASVRELRRAQPEAWREVRGVGLAGQMHGAVLLDRAGRVIRPAVLWNDGRAVKECALLERAVPDLADIAGAPASPGLTAPKLLWMAKHEPDAFRMIWKVLTPKDYLRFRLTGQAVTDMSDAAGTLWLDEAKRDWSDRILAACELDRARVPVLVEGSDAAGEVMPEVCRDLDLERPAVVAGGAGDAAAAGIGIGSIEDGDAYISLGTSGQLFVTDHRYRPSVRHGLHAFAHALPGRWFRMAAMLNGATCLEWVAGIVGRRDIAALVADVAADYVGPSRLLFLPYLSGERTPHNDPNARGVFFGLDPATTATDLVQATLEGVALTFGEAAECLEADGALSGEIAAVGGGARSAFWMQIFADVLGRPVVRYRGSEAGPAFGAARLARMALTREAPEVICRKPAILDRFEPDPARQAGYAERLVAFKALYRALKNEFQRRPASS
jgi:xylulokinase